MANNVNCKDSLRSGARKGRRTEMSTGRMNMTLCEESDSSTRSPNATEHGPRHTRAANRTALAAAWRLLIQQIGPPSEAFTRACHLRNACPQTDRRPPTSKQTADRPTAGRPAAECLLPSAANTPSQRRAPDIRPLTTSSRPPTSPPPTDRRPMAHHTPAAQRPLGARRHRQR